MYILCHFSAFRGCLILEILHQVIVIVFIQNNFRRKEHFYEKMTNTPSQTTSGMTITQRIMNDNETNVSEI